MQINPDDDKIIIPLSKIKLFLLFFCSVAFVACGIWLAFYTPQQVGTVNKYLMIAIGWAALLFFGLCAVALLVKLFNKKPGLVMDDNGITDNSGAFANGFIAWSDIINIEGLLQNKQKFIVIYVRNPEEYVNKTNFFLARKMKQANLKFYGSPITISSNGMKIKFEMLYAVLIGEYAKYIRSGVTLSQENG